MPTPLSPSAWRIGSPRRMKAGGKRPHPDLDGDTAFGWHVTESLVRQEFDLTVCQEMAIDHGIYSWLPYLADHPWPAPILPIAANMIRQPFPTSARLWKLGKALRNAVEAFPGDERVLVVATGGMSHQISGARFGIANEDLDRYFLRHLHQEPELLLRIPQEELMRVGGSEAAELSIWFAMRARCRTPSGRFTPFILFRKLQDVESPSSRSRPTGYFHAYGDADFMTISPVTNDGLADENTPFIRNAWYAACFSRDVVPGKIFSRRILGENIVLYRKTDGAVVAMKDRCPHRSLPAVVEPHRRRQHRLRVPWNSLRLRRHMQACADAILGPARTSCSGIRRDRGRTGGVDLDG